MLEQAFNWFLTTHAQILRKGDKRGFEVLMLMSIAHVFGLYTPKELADYLDIRFQPLYAHLKSLSLYSLQKLMLGLLIKVIAYLMVFRLLSQKAFKNLSLVQTLRQIRREGNLDDLINQHFHALIGGT